MMPAKDLSVIIPVYNSEATLAELVEKLCGEFSGKYDYEIILVNDGSKDQSYEVCKKIAAGKKFVKFLSLFRNYGQINALMAGLNEAEGKISLIMDDDLQNLPKDTHKLIAKINEGFDFVFGIPKKPKQSFFRIFGSRLTYWMAEIMLGKPKNLYPSSYLALTHGLAREIIKYGGPYPYLSGLIFRVSKNGTNVIVDQDPRKYGVSQYSLTKLLCLWLNGFTNFSVLPLRISSLFGLIVALIGFLVLIYLLIQKVFFTTFLGGWVSIIGAILLFSGIQLLALGIAGEYVGRIFMLLNKSPQFSIKERYNCG